MTPGHRPTTAGLLLLFAAALLAAAPAAATLLRARSLGDDLGYLEDDAGPTRWYASLVDYPDLVRLHLGQYDHDAGGSLNTRLRGAGGGVHLGLGEKARHGVLGLYVQEELPGGAPGGGATLLGARQLGRLAVGLRAQFTSHLDGTNASAEPGRGESLYFHAYGLGLRWDAGDRLYGDLAAELVNVQGDATDHQQWRLPAQQTWSSWGLRTRGFWQVDPRLVLVPLLDHREDDRQVVSDALAAPADQQARRTALGLGFQVLTDPDNLLLVSGEFRWGRQEHTRLAGQSTTWEFDRSELTWYEVHAAVGLETRLLPWLSLRGAVEYLRLQQERRSERGETAAGEPDRWADRETITVRTPITLGAAVHLGRVQVDLLLNARRWQTWGTLPFAPAPTATGTFTGVTVGYEF
jgi:hypothetical protein